MNTAQFWNEELRDFPHGGQGAAVWVARRLGPETTAPVKVLFGWSCGRGRVLDLARRPPLGTMFKAMASGREALEIKEKQIALWVEPLEDPCGGETGCLAIWFDAEEHWREGIFLWGQRLAARLRSVLSQLDSLALDSTGLCDDPQLPLFNALPSKSQAARKGPTPGSPRPGTLALPRPRSVPGIPGCIGVSREMNRLGQCLPDAARSGVNILLRGESGTGKEVVARALHLCSSRSKGPFLGQNCAALPESLFESELFGHRAGAFTGAAGDKKGLLAAASGGTFFLDEIGDMPLSLQIKLLRVMQERQIRRIGELHHQSVDIRFIAATHKDLSAEISAGRFRLDLFYRLKVVCIEIPALRHRPEDVAPLFSFFLKKCGKDILEYTITEKALSALQAWRWPGNVRELENEALRLVALHPDQKAIRLGHLSPEIQTARSGKVEVGDLGTLRELGQANEILERFLIRKAIAATEGRKAAAARRLGLSRQGLYKKIQRYGMTDLIASPSS